MRLVEEEDQLRLIEIADFRERLVHLGEQPQQKGGVDRGREHQLVGRQNVDESLAIFVDPHQVLQVQSRLAEEPIAPPCSSASNPR